MNVVLLFVIVLLSLCHSAVEGGKLYPTCQGEELQGTASAGGEATILGLREKLNEFTMSCLAYEVSSLMGGMKKGEKDPCSVPHQTEYMHRIVLRATTRNKKTGRINVTNFDVKDVAGGSIGDIAIRLPEKSHLSLVFMNTATNPKCSLRLRAILGYTIKTKDSQQNALPVMISVVPRTVYTNRSATTKFFLRYPKGTDMQKVEQDDVTLVELNKECVDDYSNGYTMRLPSSSSSLDSFDDPLTVGVRDYYFDTPETYRVCYHKKGNTEGSELAVLRVFGGNPSYYQVVEGEDEEGHIFVGVKTTIKFYGYDLDTRPGGDKAKFVRDSADCAMSEPAGGVPEATDLGPGDSYGPATTYTLWSWTLQEVGAFKVCYKRRSGAWTEVPSITDVGPETTSAPESGTARPAQVPQPTDPVTKLECPMASEKPDEPWVTYKSLKLTFKGTKMPEGFLKSFSQVFCIPRAALAVTHMTHDEELHQVMYLSLLCEDLGEAASCATVERQNYIISVGKENAEVLRNLGIQSVEGNSYLFAFGDDKMYVNNYGSHLLALLITCVTVVLVTIIAVYGVLKYRENRQYFVQFGADDADVEDMYTSGDPSDGPSSSRWGVNNAFIEVEE